MLIALLLQKTISEPNYQNKMIVPLKCPLLLCLSVSGKLSQIDVFYISNTDQIYDNQ